MRAGRPDRKEHAPRGQDEQEARTSRRMPAFQGRERLVARHDVNRAAREITSDAALTRSVMRLPAGAGSLAGEPVAADEPEEANGSVPAVAPLATFATFVTFGGEPPRLPAVPAGAPPGSPRRRRRFRRRSDRHRA